MVSWSALFAASAAVIVTLCIRGALLKGPRKRAILDVLAERGDWMFGLEIAKTGACPRGIVYSLLHELERDGFVASKWELDAPLTHGQAEVLRFIDAFIGEHGDAPTVAHVADHFSIQPVEVAQALVARGDRVPRRLYRITGSGRRKHSESASAVPEGGAA